MSSHFQLRLTLKGKSIKKPLFLASLSALCLPLAASAQEAAPKVEIFGGHSYLRDDTTCRNSFVGHQNFVGRPK
jgi:hypothetical protein